VHPVGSYCTEILGLFAYTRTNGWTYIRTDGKRCLLPLSLLNASRRWEKTQYIHKQCWFVNLSICDMMKSLFRFL